MNVEIKEQWLKALRSGDYKQSKNNLHDSNGYCCLGVLCDLAVKAGVLVENEIYCEPCEQTHLDYQGNTAYPPATVVEWAGLNSENPLVSERDPVNGANSTSLATLNDNGRSFAEIADLIEAHL